jgi:hypothetical protein
MPGPFAKSIALLLVLALMAVAGANAQTYRKRKPREVEPAAPPASVDKRDSVVTGGGAPFTGRPYWLALAQCGGIYFKLDTLYTDAAVQARVVKPDPRSNSEFTKKLNEAIRTATVYFDAAERFLMNDRGIERADAVLTYDAQSRAAGDRFKTIDSALAVAKGCPALYHSCRDAYPKACTEAFTAPD